MEVSNCCNKSRKFYKQEVRALRRKSLYSFLTSKLSWQVSVYFSAKVVKLLLLPNFAISSPYLCLCTVETWEQKRSNTEAATSCLLLNGLIPFSQNSSHFAFLEQIKNWNCSTSLTFVIRCRWSSCYFPYFGCGHVAGTSVVTPHGCHDGLLQKTHQLLSLCSLF